MIVDHSELLGLDVGSARIGVARMNTVVLIAQPLEIIDAKRSDPVTEILTLMKEHNSDAIVVGLPRGLDGQESEQTKLCRQFALELRRQVDVPVYLIDEAGTSKEANERRKLGAKGTTDSIAAGILLDNFVVMKQHDRQEVG